MNIFFEILKNDLRLIFRDKSLLIMFIIPIAVIICCRFGAQPITNYYPVIEDYYWLIVASLTAVTASAPSYLMGFILLDEKDESVNVLLRILPLPNNFILKIRIAFIAILGYTFSLFILLFNGLIYLNFYIAISLSVLFALIPLVLTSAIIAFAKNKIEAAAMYKGLNTFLIFPIVAFFLPGYLKYFFGIVPFFWTFNALHEINSPGFYVLSFFISIFTQLLLAGILYKIYMKKQG